MESLRKSRLQDIREQQRRRTFDHFVYFLLEPDAELIRYVGICVDPLARFSGHVGCGSKKPKTPTPVRKWIESLKARGTLPRMMLAGKVCDIGLSCEREIDFAQIGAAAVERDLIKKLESGMWCGNLSIPHQLLNVAHSRNARS